MKKRTGLLLFFVFFFFSGASASDIPSAEEMVRALKPQKNRGLIRGLADMGKSDERPRITLRLQFAMDSAKLKGEDIPPLRNLGKALQDPELCTYVFKIEGHTCDLGSHDYNSRLSRKRAAAVQDFLMRNFGLSKTQFEIAGYGEMQPEVPNTGESARKQNRRVVIKNTLQKVSLNTPGSGKVAVQLKCIRDFQEDVVKDGDTLTQQNAYAVEFKPRKRLYVYIYQSDSAGKLSCLFPNPQFSVVRNPVKAGHLYRVPGQGKVFHLDANTGREDIIVFAAESALAEPDRICRNLLNNPSAPSEGEMMMASKGKSRAFIIKEKRGVAGIADDFRDTPVMTAAAPQVKKPAPVPKKKSRDIFVWKRYFMHE